MDLSQLPHLETFATAAELVSFSAAGRALGLTQAAVSLRIQALEGILDVALFHRRAGRVELTDAGKRLHPLARRIVALNTEARAAVTGRPVRTPGKLSLAASSVPGEHFLPELLTEFRERHPQISVRATVGDSQTVRERVERGRSDLGLLGVRDNDSHLEYRSFAQDRMALIVPADHPLAKRRRVPLERLRREPLIVREAGSGSRRCLEQGLALAGKSLRDLHVATELGSNEAIQEAVLRGLGVAFLSSAVIKNAVHNGRLRALTVTGLDLKREILAAWDSRRPLTMPARLFLDLLDGRPATVP